MCVREAWTEKRKIWKQGEKERGRELGREKLTKIARKGD